MRLYALLNREFQICKCVLFFFFLLLHHSSPFISKYFFLLPYDRIKPEFSINLKGQVNGVVSKYLSLFREARSPINLINGGRSRTRGVYRKHDDSPTRAVLFERRKIHKNEVGIYLSQSKRCTGSPKSEVTRPLPIRQVIIRLVNNGQCALTNSSHICLTRI